VPNRLLCGSCNDWQVDVIAGDEMLLQRVEIEPADEPVH
jgi:Zn finger protein HypA/HybF involved in hydrogenase expression